MQVMTVVRRKNRLGRNSVKKRSRMDMRMKKRTRCLENREEAYEEYEWSEGGL